MMRSALWVLAIVALGVTACRSTAQSANAPPAGQSQAAPGTQALGANDLSPEVRRLIQAARDNGETELNVSWGATSLGGPEAARRFEALMNQTYGTNIKITLIPGPSQPDIANKITQELHAGHKASTDVYLGLDTYYASMLPRDVLEPYDYTQLSPRITREIVAERNIGVEVYSSIPAITYNTELVSSAEVPRRLEDVLQAKWRGKIAGAANASYLDGVSVRPEWGTDRMKAYVARLSEYVGGLIRQSEDHRVITGEFVMFVLGNTHSVREQQARGAPLGAAVPEDVAQVGTVHLGVPRNSAHPNLGKLYINTVLSEAGQHVLWETYLSDHHQLPGSRSAADLVELQAKGVPIQKLNVRFFLDHPELPQLTAELQAILREKRGG
jgi:ABC-type Fe3+ transport system substrate-binding protein